jgi:hypothetical protein
MILTYGVEGHVTVAGHRNACLPVGRGFVTVTHS